MVQFTEDGRPESPLHKIQAGMRSTSNAAQKLREDLRKSRPFETGTIIAWRSISDRGISYEYAAIYAGGRWYTTLQKDNVYVQRSMSHSELLGYFAERGDHIADLRVAVEFEAVSL